jgi:hypothetical protein
MIAHSKYEPDEPPAWRFLTIQPWHAHVCEPLDAIQMRHIEMRTTLNIEDKLIQKASELTGIKEETTLVKLGLEALIARKSARRLAKLGGTEKQLNAIPRRRITEQ